MGAACGLDVSLTVCPAGDQYDEVRATIGVIDAQNTIYWGRRHLVTFLLPVLIELIFTITESRLLVAWGHHLRAIGGIQPILVSPPFTH